MDCQAQLEIVRGWFFDDHLECATRLVEGYLDTKKFTGAKFHHLAAGTDPYRIDDDDIKAVRSLRVGFPPSFIDCLSREATKEKINKTLKDIPTDNVLKISPVKNLSSCSDLEVWRGTFGWSLSTP